MGWTKQDIVDILRDIGSRKASDILQNIDMYEPEIEEILEGYGDDSYDIFRQKVERMFRVYEKNNKGEKTMRVEKSENKEKEKQETKRQVIEVTEDVRIPGTKIILEKGDKVEVFTKSKKDLDEKKELDEAANVSFSVSFNGVDGSFAVTKEMDYVYDEGSEEPKEVERIVLDGSFSINIECGSMPEVSAIENAVKTFANSFAKEKVE